MTNGALRGPLFLCLAAISNYTYCITFLMEYNVFVTKKAVIPNNKRGGNKMKNINYENIKKHQDGATCNTVKIAQEMIGDIPEGRLLLSREREKLEQQIAAFGEEANSVRAFLVETAKNLIKETYSREDAGWKWDDKEGNKRLAEALDLFRECMKDILDYGTNPVEKAKLEEMAKRLDGIEVAGFTLQGRAWMRGTEKRIYVSLEDGITPRPSTFYCKGGKVFWKFPPKTRPDWADEVIAAIEAALNNA